jgi:hypothetical protein
VEDASTDEEVLALYKGQSKISQEKWIPTLKKAWYKLEKRH